MTISNSLLSHYKNFKKVSILDATKVHYPMRHLLANRDIVFNEAMALQVVLLPEDLKFPSTGKDSDAGTAFEYKVEISVIDQENLTRAQLLAFINKKVIAVFHHNEGKVILGCNEMPFKYLFHPENTTSPSGTSGFTIELRGNMLIPQASR